MKSSKVHGRTMWCDRVICVWADKDGWFAAIRNDDSDMTIAQSGPWPSSEAAEDQLCLFLTGIVKTGVEF
jgi:hypothetical protein